MTESAYYDTPEFFGQATDEGQYDDVAFDNVIPLPADSDMRLAVGLVLASLVLLWLMGAAIFKGSNQS